MPTVLPTRWLLTRRWSSTPGRRGSWQTRGRFPPGRHPSGLQRGNRPCSGPCRHRQALRFSFVVRPEGTLLDGTPLKDAIAAIDAAVTPRPLAYLINCTHVSFAGSALMHGANSSPLVRHRIIGLLANTAALSPEDLNDSTSLVEEDPEVFGQSVAGLHRELGLKILGGCCGTDDRHIRSLAAQLAIQARQTNSATQKTL